MPNFDDQAWIVDALLAPLMLPRRVMRDLEAIGEAARGLPAFEDALMAQLEELGADVRGFRATLERLEDRVASIQAEVPELAGDLGAAKNLVADLSKQVGGAIELLPDPDSPGLIARAHEAIVGNDPSGEPGSRR